MELIVAAMTVLAALQAAPSADRTADEAAVRAVVAEYLHAREQRDPAAVGALFTADADQLTSSGDWRRGRDEIVKGTLASSERTGGRRTITIQRVRFPNPDTALADGPYELAGADQGTRKMWTSFVFVRDGNHWRIAAIRNMLPAPAAAPAAK